MSSPARGRIFGLLLASSLLLALCCGACLVELRSLECYKCPCGSLDYLCVKGVCIHKENRARFPTDGEIEFYIQQKCTPGATDGGGDCPCPADQTCDPQTQKCVPKVTCPNGKEPRPDGTCPSPCHEVTCQGGLMCDPDTGKCVQPNCRLIENFCQAPTCCNVAKGECVRDCLACNKKCAEGYACHEASRTCLKQGSCRPPGSSCQSRANCCGRPCLLVPFEGNRPNERWVLQACECNSDADCPLGKSCLTLSLSGQQSKKICSCRTHLDCAPSGQCQKVRGLDLCVRRVQ